MIRYRFEFAENSIREFFMDEQGDTSQEGEDMVEMEEWMLLSAHRCPGCEIEPDSRLTCPAALAVSPVIRAFGDRVSHDPVDVTVERDNIRITTTTSTQQAVRSILGLLLALSSCPVMKMLRPMAHFHLPMGDAKNTVFRVLGTFLIAQYLRQSQGLAPDWSMAGLLSLYEQIHEVNVHLAERLRAASLNDAAINSLVILDALGQEVGHTLTKNLEKLRPLFSMYLEPDAPPPESLAGKSG
ncbi:MAG: hypothetical protein KKA60_10205 [Proteobacteria bacterium]|nr:hypothetical protein [Pseudomonadota bacterium]